MEKVRVLFVCMGNICRSPTAEGVFSHLVTKAGLGDVIIVDSAGTHAYHIGEPPDRRAQQIALKRDVDISKQMARRIVATDFEAFDYVLAMDRDNQSNMLVICPVEHQHKVKLFLEFAPHLGEQDVPDPYYGGTAGFERVIDMIEAASEGLLGHIRSRHLQDEN